MKSVIKEIHMDLDNHITFKKNDKVKDLLEKYPSEVDVFYEDGLYFLLAMSDGNLEILEMLLQYFTKNHPEYDKDTEESLKTRKRLSEVLQNAVERHGASEEIERLIEPYLYFEASGTGAEQTESLKRSLGRQDLETTKADKEVEEDQDLPEVIPEIQSSLKLEKVERCKGIEVQVESTKVSNLPSSITAATAGSDSRSEAVVDRVKCIFAEPPPQKPESSDDLQTESGSSSGELPSSDRIDSHLEEARHESTTWFPGVPGVLKNAFKYGIGYFGYDSRTSESERFIRKFSNPEHDQIGIEKCLKGHVHITIFEPTPCKSCKNHHQQQHYAIPEQECYKVIQKAIIEKDKWMTVNVLERISKECILKQKIEYEKIIRLAIKRDVASTETVKVLLEVDHEFATISDKGGFTILHIAVKSNNKELAELIIEKAPKTLSHVDKWGQTALHWAADNWNEEIVRLLISKMSEEDILKESYENYHKAICFAKTKTMKKKMISLIQDKDIYFPDEEGEYEPEDLLDDLEFMAPKYVSKDGAPKGLNEIVIQYLDSDEYREALGDG